MERVLTEYPDIIASAIMASMGQIAKMVCSIASILVAFTGSCHNYFIIIEDSFEAPSCIKPTLNKPPIPCFASAIGTMTSTLTIECNVTAQRK